MRSFRAIRLNLKNCWEIRKISNMKLNTVVAIGPCGQHVQHGSAMSAGAVAGDQLYGRDGGGSFRCCLCESGRRADVIATTSRIAWHCLRHSPQKKWKSTSDGHYYPLVSHPIGGSMPVWTVRTSETSGKFIYFLNKQPADNLSLSWDNMRQLQSRRKS